MTGGKIVIALGLVIGAVLIQTTVFQYIRPLGYAPELGLLTVIAISRYLDAEQAMLAAFTGGFLQDLLGGSPLGLWAIAFTVVAFVTVKVRAREVVGPPAVAIGVFGLTIAGLVTYMILGTLFGLGIIGRPGVIWDLLVPAIYNLVLAFPVLWLVKIAIRPQERSMVR